MAKQKQALASKPAAQPTFVPFDWDNYWDHDADKPHSVSAYDLEDDDVMAAVVAAEAQYQRWRQVCSDPAEAEARRAHAEQVARYLVGVFPACRVNTDAYALAAGEDLERFGADVVHDVALHIRRKAKSLPPLSALIEAAEAQAAKREAVHRIHAQALRSHADGIERGKVLAQQIADAMAASGVQPTLTADDVHALWRCIYGCADLGIPVDCSPTGRACERVAQALFKRLSAGDAKAAAHAASMVQQRARMIAAETDIAKTEDERSADAWAEEKVLDDLTHRLPALLGVPKPPHYPTINDMENLHE